MFCLGLEFLLSVSVNNSSISFVFESNLILFLNNLLLVASLPFPLCSNFIIF